MRPIHKRNFGAKAGKLAVKFYDGSSVKTGWVLAQLGTAKYKITDGTTTVIRRLCQTTTEITALTAGTGPDAAYRTSLCTIEITPHGGSVENVKRLHEKRALTVQGSTVSWKLGVASSAAGQGTVASVANVAPTVANPIPDQTGTVAGAFTFTFAANAFADLNADTLTYTATQNGGALTVFAFNAATRTFTKAAGAGAASVYTMVVTASDGAQSITDTFLITLS